MGLIQVFALTYDRQSIMLYDTSIKEREVHFEA